MKKSLLALLIFAFAGCATIVSSGPDRVPIDSNPSNARVLLNGQPVGRTPMVLTPSRRDQFELKIELDGYEPVVISRDKSFNGWVIGNVLFGGIIGIVVDVATHNASKHSENPVYAELTLIDDAKKASTTKVRMKRKPATTDQ